MENEKIETTNSENGEAEVVETKTTEEVVEESEEDLDAKNAQLKARIAKAEENKKLYSKAKLAEEEAKKLKERPNSEADLSTKDVLFLAKADVHEDDIDEVLEWAKFKKVSVSEAHKQLKGVLAGKAEERKTAQATNTGTARRGTSKVSDESLLESAKSGNLPDSDTDLDRLVKARMERQRSKA